MAARPFAFAALALTAGLAAPALAAAPPDGLEFQGARLGMSLKDWRAVPAPPGAGPDAVPICTDEDRTVRIPGYPLSAEEVRAGAVACSFKARFGRAVLTHSIRIDPNFHATNLAYVFRRGRLDQIRFTAATDAYGDIRRLFGLRGGRADTGLRAGRHRTWRIRGAQVRIARGPNPSELVVDLIRR